ncbi:MAG: Fe-S cluster protein [Nitrospirae bacterium GWD2_57_9]|nr:MAG: Fe-S cluster protein [Nitrospirae bacterium GWD2_57_9]
MLLKGYRAEIFLPTCNSHFQSLHCIAHLDQDVGAVLPYLNAVLGGDTFIKEPPSLTLKLNGKLLTIHARKIAVNALRDEAEVHSVLEWIKGQINEAWQNRDSLVPKYDGAGKAHPLTIYKLLPRSNCRKCGQPTCMAFAALAATGALGADQCGALDGPGRSKLADYLGSFRFE